MATDVAARGLDIPKIALVINYDLPQDSKPFLPPFPSPLPPTVATQTYKSGLGTTYIHRVGRTARAGNTGRSISFVTQYDMEIWLRIEAALGKKVDEYPAAKDEVMIFRGRVEEGCRYARSEMNDQRARGSKIGAKPQRAAGKAKGRAGRAGRNGDMDREEE